MLLVTTENVPGRKTIEPLGVVKGNTVQAKHLGKDIIGGLRNLVGGRMREYEEMFLESREYAEKQMIEEAKKLGADAVVCVRYTSSSIMEGSSEVLVYGTAVRLSD
ncbi:YbjQ family protein [Desertibacillus haloalkaliphilus]|uniref:YbjQ family protein n=1 Tax=Desertibacillus haloalkaliphilus TaxID=1328930 RepID=UPI001C257A86|nr:YbjQ family protein [Desertibacillus haloalkaliphilus]MBU8907960.1 YbjQ family protein [Desertibacillus haloalkaliphilus]